MAGWEAWSRPSVFDMTSPMPRADRGQPGVPHDVDGRQGGGAGHRIAAVGATQPAGMDRLHQVGPTRDRGQGISRGEGLCRGHEIGNHPFVLAGEPVAGPAEAGLDLVGGQQHRMVPAPGGKGGQEPGSGHHEPAFPLDGLDEHAGHVVRTHEPVDLLERPPRRLLPGHPLGIAEGVRHRHAVDLGGEGTELVPVGHVLGGEGHGQVGAPVVRVVEHDHGLPAGDVPGDLDRVLDGLGPGVEQDGTLRSRLPAPAR